MPALKASLAHQGSDRIRRAVASSVLVKHAAAAVLGIAGDHTYLGRAGAPIDPASSTIIGHFEVQPRDLVVLTREMSRPRSDWNRDLAFHGFTTWDAATKKVQLLAAADPDSLSGTARKARDYGIPAVAESWLLERWPWCY